MKAVSAASAIFIVVLLTGCSLWSMDSLDYNSDEGCFEKRIREYSFRLKPISAEKLAEMNMADASASEQEKEMILKEYRNFLCFVLDVNIDGLRGELASFNGSPGEDFSFEKKDAYYLFNMQSDITLLLEDSTRLPCKIFHYERPNEVTPWNRFIVGFDAPKCREFTFEYDNPHFSCGKINFFMNKELTKLNQRR